MVYFATCPELDGLYLGINRHSDTFAGISLLSLPGGIGKASMRDVGKSVGHLVSSSEKPNALQNNLVWLSALVLL